MCLASFFIRLVEYWSEYECQIHVEILSDEFQLYDRKANHKDV
jgi:hypothetical protein